MSVPYIFAASNLNFLLLGVGLGIYCLRFPCLRVAAGVFQAVVEILLS